MPTPETKVCHGVTLPASAFAANRKKADGLQTFCRDCQKTLRAEWVKNNPEKVAATNAARRKGEPRQLIAPSTKGPIATLQASSHTGERVVELQPTNFAFIHRAEVVPSLTNPRKHFDPAFLSELADSIRAQGIAQPILVRPLPGSRLEETYTDRRADAPRPTHEIVAGEQRWRAAELAGLRTVPIYIRHLSDEQVLELQLVENLKRRDLHPMEEAEGYERLRTDMGVSAEDIGDKIGKKKSYVYKTLKLLDLTADAREAFYAGKLTRSTAELIAAREPGLQAQILKELVPADFKGEPVPFTKARDLIHNRFMLRLGTAPFDTDDPALVPGAGPCGTCPKRSGANPELFDDVDNADTCTDVDCFASKKDAHYLRIRADADAKGMTVIVGREAKEIMPTSGTLRGYVRLDAPSTAGSDMRSLRQVLGDDMPAPTLIEDPRTHEMVEALPTATVGQLLKAQGLSKPPAVVTSEAEALRQGVEQFEKAWRHAAVERIDKALTEDTAGGFNAPVLRLLAAMLVDGLGKDQLQHLSTLLGLGKVAQRDAIATHIRECDEDDVDRVLLLLLVQHDLNQVVDSTTGKASAATRIETVSGEYGVDVAAIKRELKAEAKRALSAQKVDAAAAAVKASAGPAKPARKPKTTAAEAAAAIAEQMQKAENPNGFAAGQRVRIKTDLRRGVDVFSTLDTYGELLKPEGDSAWVVQPDALNFPLTAHYTEIEVTES